VVAANRGRVDRSVLLPLVDWRSAVSASSGGAASAPPTPLAVALGR